MILANAAVVCLGGWLLLDSVIQMYYLDRGYGGLTLWIGLLAVSSCCMVAFGCAGVYCAVANASARVEKVRNYFVALVFSSVFLLFFTTYLMTNDGSVALHFKREIEATWPTYYADLPDDLKSGTGGNCDTAAMSDECWQKVKEFYFANWRVGQVVLGLYILVLLPTCLYFAGCIVGWATAFDAVQDIVAYIEICIGILLSAFIVYLYVLNASDNQYVVVSDTYLYAACFFGAAVNFLLGVTALCPKTCACCVTEQAAGRVLFFAYAAAVALAMGVKRSH